MSQAEFSARMGLSEKAISQIINCKAPITPGTAVKIEYVLGTPASIWNNLQRDYEECLARDKSRASSDAEWEIAKRIPYQEVSLLGEAIGFLFPPHNDRLAAIDMLRRFFGVSSLENILNAGEAWPIAAYRSTGTSKKHAADPYAIATWLRSGEIIASKIECSTFDIKKLNQELPKIRAYLSDPNIENAWKKIVLDLLRCGVKLVAVPHMKKTYVNGAVRWIGENPTIIVNTRNAYVDILWFTVFHELAHVKLHGKRYACITAEGGSFLDKPEEKEADDFAGNILIPKVAYDNFVSDMDFREERIINFAKSIHAPMETVVGRLCHDEKIYWGAEVRQKCQKVRVSISH
jgi:HTH-type transcriptional regulator/antitoxin HigA